MADRYPDGVFDVLVIDGTARASRAVRIGGAILLDDSERASYRPAVEAARRAEWPEPLRAEAVHDVIRAHDDLDEDLGAALRARCPACCPVIAQQLAKILLLNRY